MILGRWAFRLPPLEGELLSSCLARNAYAHGTAPQRFLELFWPREAMWNRDFDRNPAALGRPGKAGVDWLAEIAERLGVSADVVRRATLQEWREALAGERLPSRGDTPLLLSAGVHHRARRLHGLQYCPECLGEGTAHYRRTWRLGFVVACEAHGHALVDSCPHCDAPVVPHRAPTRLTDCHACGAALTRAGGGKRVPDVAIRLQRGLLALLDGAGEARVGPWTTRDAFVGVRTLLAVSAARPVHQALRNVLRLGAAVFPDAERLRFERLRVGLRAACLETAAAWADDWPASFREGAFAAGLTRCSFARAHLDGALAAEVARLPAGATRRHPTYVPLLEDPVLRRLRRCNPSAYRAARARCILSALRRPA